MSFNLSDPRKAYRPNASDNIETKAHCVERLRAELMILNGHGRLAMSSDWHSARLACVAEIIGELKALGEKIE